MKYAKRSPVGALSEAEYTDVLKKQLWSINNILVQQEFFEPMIPSISGWTNSRR